MQREQTFMTMTEVAGYNTRKIRLLKGLSQEQLRVGLAEWGIHHSRPTVALMEAGKRALSVDELLALAFVLGVAPQQLLYPPRGTKVGKSEEFAYPGWLIASWMWNPDEKVGSLSHARLRERRFLLDSLDLDEQLTDDDVTRLAQKALTDVVITETEAPVDEAVTEPAPKKTRKSTKSKGQAGGRTRGAKA